MITCISLFLLHKKHVHLYMYLCLYFWIGSFCRRDITWSSHQTRSYCQKKRTKSQSKADVWYKVAYKVLLFIFSRQYFIILIYIDNYYKNEKNITFFDMVHKHTPGVYVFVWSKKEQGRKRKKKNTSYAFFFFASRGNVIEYHTHSFLRKTLKFLKKN